MRPKCPECDGHGYHDERDWDGFHWRRYVCVFCHGSGEADVDDTDEDGDGKS